MVDEITESVLNDIEQGEEQLTFKDVRKHPLLRQPGQKPADLATIYRWAERGLRGVKLEFIVTPRGRRTTRSALLRFFHRLTQAAKGEAPTARTRRRREMELDRASKRLDALGI